MKKLILVLVVSIAMMFTSCEKSQLEPAIIEETVEVVQEVQVNWVDSLFDSYWQKDNQEQKIGFEKYGGYNNISFNGWSPFEGGFSFSCEISNDSIYIDTYDITYVVLGELIYINEIEGSYQTYDTLYYPSVIIIESYDLFNLKLNYDGRDNNFIRLH